MGWPSTPFPTLCPYSELSRCRWGWVCSREDLIEWIARTVEACHGDPRPAASESDAAGGAAGASAGAAAATTGGTRTLRAKTVTGTARKSAPMPCRRRRTRRRISTRRPDAPYKCQTRPRHRDSPLGTARPGPPTSGPHALAVVGPLNPSKLSLRRSGTAWSKYRPPKPPRAPARAGAYPTPIANPPPPPPPPPPPTPPPPPSPRSKRLPHGSTGAGLTVTHRDVFGDVERHQHPAIPPPHTPIHTPPPPQPSTTPDRATAYDYLCMPRMTRTALLGMPRTSAAFFTAVGTN